MVLSLGHPHIGAMKDSAKIKVRSNTTFVDTEETEQVHWNKSNAVYDRSDEGPVLSEGALYSKYKVGLGFPPKSQTNKQTNKTELKEKHDKVQRGNVPSNLKSRLLAPTEREYVPKARIHD